MSNIRAITGSTKIMNRPTHGGSKKQGIPSSTNLNTWSHVAFRNRNVVCPCNRGVVFCMNQLGGVGAGGVPGNSYMFAPNADGVNKNKILCGVNHSNIPIHILQKITDKKLLITGPKYNASDIKTYFPILNFNNKKLHIVNSNSLTDKFLSYLKNDKHYIFEFILVGPPYKKYKVFFTLVKRNSPAIYDYEIKNVSPSNINVSDAVIDNIKLSEVDTKYI